MTTTKQDLSWEEILQDEFEHSHTPEDYYEYLKAQETVSQETVSQETVPF